MLSYLSIHGIVKSFSSHMSKSFKLLWIFCIAMNIDICEG